MRTAGASVAALLRGSTTPPPGAIVVDLSQVSRWLVEWTPALLREADRSGSLGDSQLVAALCDDMLRDDRLRAVLETRAKALLGREVSFEAGEGVRRRRALRAAEAEADFWEMFPEAEMIQLLMWGFLLNRGPARWAWWEVDGAGGAAPRRRRGRLVPELSFWHPRAFRRDVTTGAWWARVDRPDAPLGAYEEVPVTWGDGEWCMFAPYGGAGDPTRGLWAALALLWLLKLFALRDWGNLTARMGEPTRVIEFALGQQGVNVKEFATDSVREALVKKIFAMGKRGVVALPPGFTMKLMSVPATNKTMFEAQIDMVNKAYAITVNGQNLMTDVSGGSFAATTAHNLVREDIMRFDAGCEASFERRQGLTFWAAVNFNDPEAAPWPLRDVAPPEDQTQTAKTWDTLCTAAVKAKSVGWMFDMEVLKERFKMPLVATPPTSPATTPNASS